MSDCDAPLHPAAVEGLRLFNLGEYFEAHEALEQAWRADPGPVRDLYRGILQIAVTYLHITRGNYQGAIKVYSRSQKWLRAWPEVCRGVDVGQLRRDAEAVFAELGRLGPSRLASFDRSLLRAIRLAVPDAGRDDGLPTFPAHSNQTSPSRKRVYTCDRCGAEMRERNCKISCPNCGNRFDCSDLNIYFD